MPKQLIAACDGACKKNPGPAGWGWVVADDQERVQRWAYGPLGAATNNIAELTALRELLLSVDADAELEIRMDSTYAMNAVTTWLPGWKKRGWKRADGQPVLNRELIESIEPLLTGRAVTFRHVKAHQADGDVLNALADRAASAAANTQQAAQGAAAETVPAGADEVPVQRRSSNRPAARPGGIAAKFAGTCRCGAKYQAGDKITKGGDGRWGHPDCG